MSEILQMITPKWEEEEIVWASKTNTDQGGGGYFYASIRTPKSVIGNYRGLKANSITLASLADELNSSALFMLSSIFVYERNTLAWMETVKDERESTEQAQSSDKAWIIWREFESLQDLSTENQNPVDEDIDTGADPCETASKGKKVAIKTVTIQDQLTVFLDKMIIEDKNIAFPSCFKNTLLVKISFTDIINLLTKGKPDYANFEKSEILPELATLLGLIKPIPPVSDDCCDCVTSPAPPPEPVPQSRPINSPPPGWSTKTYAYCCGPFQGEGIPPPQKLFSGCTWMPKLKENEYLTQTQKLNEDRLLRLGCHIRTCAQAETKGKTDFVGDQIGPPPLPGEKPAPCGDVESIQSMKDALDYVITPFGIKGLVKKAAQCTGLDLSLEDLKEMIIMAFIENLDCNQIIKLVDKVEQLTGVDIRGGQKIIGYIAKEIGPIIDKLPAKEIKKIAQHLQLDPKFVGAIDTKDISACAVISVKMPQEIKQIANHLGGLPGEQLVGFLLDFNLAEQALINVCEKYKKEIVELLREVLDRVNLDDLLSPGEININLELPNLIGSLGNIDFSFLDVNFGIFSTTNLGTDAAPINWGALWPTGGFNVNMPNIGSIDWSKLGDVDFSKLGIIFEAFGKIDLSKIRNIDFGVDINFDFLTNIDFSEIGAQFTALGKIDFKVPVFNPSVLLNINFPEIDFGQLGDIFKLLGNIDFGDIIKSLGGAIGNIADKFEKIVKNALDIDLSNISADFFNDLQINPPNFLPELPTIDLPDLLPTTDFMASYANGIAEMISTAVTQATISMVKGVLMSVCQACDQGDIGDLDIGSTLAESAKSSFSASKVKQAQENVINEIKKLTPEKISTSDTAQMLDGLVSDVSGILKPGEVSNLLLGRASPDITEAIECLVQQKPGYAAIAPAINGSAQINKLFAAIGELADKEILAKRVEELTKPKKPDSDRPLLPGCETPQEEQDRTALVEMGIDDPDEIEKQIESARKRKKKKFKELADLLAKKNVLDGVLPSAGCSSSPTGGKNRGLEPEEPKALKDMRQVTVNCLYDGVYMAFNQDIARFPEAIGVTKPVTKSIPRTLKTENDEGEEVVYINPELRRLASDGVIIPDFNIEDDGEDQEDEPNFKTVVPSLQIAPELKGYFNDFENNPSLFRSFPSRDGGLYQMVVPNKTEIEKFDISKFNLLKDPRTGEPLDVGLPGQIESALKKSEFRIYYEVFNSQEPDKENYKIKIESYVSSSQLHEQTASLFSTSTLPSGTALPNSMSLGSDNDLGFIGGSLINAPYNPVNDFTLFLGNKFRVGSLSTPNPVITTGQHDEIFNDILANITKQCAKSEFFDTQTLRLVEFTPQLTEKQKKCGCRDPHLLDLEEIKKEVLEEYEKEQCEDDSYPTEDATEGPTLGAFEDAALGGIIQTIIRLYVIDLTLRAIFVLSEFPVYNNKDTFNEFLDSLTVSYYTKNIVDDLVKRDKAYAVEFQRQAILYHNKIAAKKDWKETQDAGVAIGELVSLQTDSVGARLTQILGKSWGTYNINQILTEHWLPMFDLPQQPNGEADKSDAPKEPRFGKPGLSFSQSPGAKFQVVRDIKDFLDRQIPKLSPDNSLSDITLAAGLLKSFISGETVLGEAKIAGSMYKGDKYDSSNQNSVQQKYLVPAIESLSLISGRASNGDFPDPVIVTAWEQWPKMSGAFLYPSNSTNYKTLTPPTGDTVKTLTFEQIQQLNYNKREVYHFKNWGIDPSVSERRNSVGLRNGLKTRENWFSLSLEALPYWNKPESRPDGTIWSNGFADQPLADILMALKAEIDYYKAHMVYEWEDEVRGPTTELRSGYEFIGRVLNFNNYRDSNNLNAILAMRATQSNAVKEKILDFARYHHAGLRRDLNTFLEGHAFRIKAGKLFYSRGDEWLRSADVEQFAYNFYQQQLRFAARITSYEKVLGDLLSDYGVIVFPGPPPSPLEIWASSENNGFFRGMLDTEHNTEAHAPPEDPNQHRGLLQIAAHNITDDFNKTVTSAYGGPPGGLSMLKNIEKFSVAGGPGNTTFKLDNGNLILERYVKKNSAVDGYFNIQNTADWRSGAVSLDTFKNLVRNKMAENPTMTTEVLAGVKLGLRMTYVPPVDPRGFDDPNDIDNIPQGPKIIQEKAYNLIEELNVKPEFQGGLLEGKTKKTTTTTTDGITTTSVESIKAQRRVFPIPLFEAELEPFRNPHASAPPSSQAQYATITDLHNDLLLDDSSGLALWKNFNGALMEDLIGKPEFKFLFDYCFPLKRMIFLVMLYNMIYFSFDKDVLNLFNGTKEELKSTFYSLLNAGDYTYKDKAMENIGGNKGLVTALENGDDIPGIDLAGILARYPLVILKGLAEQTDSNIGIAKKIHDGAVMGGVDLPMVMCSLLGLPMNIIPPPPIGPGIGPPIGPLGIAYLALDAASSLPSPEEKKLRKKNALENKNINLDQAKNASGCPEAPEGG